MLWEVKSEINLGSEQALAPVQLPDTKIRQTLHLFASKHSPAEERRLGTNLRSTVINCVDHDSNSDSNPPLTTDLEDCDVIKGRRRDKERHRVRRIEGQG